MLKADSVLSTPPVNTPTILATDQLAGDAQGTCTVSILAETAAARPRLELVQDAAFSLDVFHRRGSLRRAVENQIEMLIEFLDYIDSASEDEASGDDEPSLGWTRAGALGDHRDIETGEVTA